MELQKGSHAIEARDECEVSNEVQSLDLTHLSLVRSRQGEQRLLSPRLGRIVAYFGSWQGFEESKGASALGKFSHYVAVALRGGSVSAVGDFV